MMDKAIGVVETRGYLGLAAATDAMNKAASVEFIRQEHIGSGYVTTIVGGEVGAVRSSVAAGKEYAQQIGTLLHAEVIPQLHPQARDLCIDWKYPDISVSPGTALGLVETQGYVPMLLASDAGVKASDVILTNYYVIGSGFSIIAMRGDVAAVREAVDAGVPTARQAGKVISSHVIPRPHPQIEFIFKLGAQVEKDESKVNGKAQGYMETHGLVALIAATDEAVKAAHVLLVGFQRIGSGIVSSILKGDVAAVRSAVKAGQIAGERVGKFLTANVIPAPHKAIEISAR